MPEFPGHQLLTELAVVGDAGVAQDVVVRPPAEVRGEQLLVAEQRVEVRGEVLGRGVVARVDEGAGRQQPGVVGAPQQHGDRVQLQRVEDLLGDVVAAHRVLEAEVEPVVVLQKVASEGS